MNQLLVRVSFGHFTNTSLLQAMMDLAQGKPESFIKFMRKYLQQSLSYFDAATQEKPYQLLMFGLMAQFAHSHHVRSNRESGDGRYDIALEPRRNGYGLIFEVKVAQQGEDLTQVAQKAYDQIVHKSYQTEMQARGVKDFLLMGLAFRGKEVEVVTRELA